MPVPLTGIAYSILATRNITNGINGYLLNYINVAWPIAKIAPLTGAQVAKLF